MLPVCNYIGDIIWVEGATKRNSPHNDFVCNFYHNKKNVFWVIYKLEQSEQKKVSFSKKGLKENEIEKINREKYFSTSIMAGDIPFEERDKEILIFLWQWVKFKFENEYWVKTIFKDYIRPLSVTLDFNDALVKVIDKNDMEITVADE